MALNWGPLSDGVCHLCIDMQNLFATGAPWYAPWLDRVRPVVERIAAAHASQTVFTRFIPPARPEHMPGRWQAFYRHWPQVIGQQLDPAWIELLPELAALVPPAAVIDKSFYSPFSASALDAVLHARSIHTVVLTGAETDICVLAGALHAVDRGLRTIIVSDGVCSSSDEVHDAVVTLYQRRFSHQIEVASSDEICEMWR